MTLSIPSNTQKSKYLTFPTSLSEQATLINFYKLVLIHKFYCKKRTKTTKTKLQDYNKKGGCSHLSVTVNYYYCYYWFWWLCSWGRDHYSGRSSSANWRHWTTTSASCRLRSAAAERPLIRCYCHSTTCYYSHAPRNRHGQDRIQSGGTEKRTRTNQDGVRSVSQCATWFLQ